MMKQLNSQVSDMTSWRTVDQLKAQHEATILQMKHVHETELRKLEEKAVATNLAKERNAEMDRKELENLQQELALVKDKTRQLEEHKSFLQNTVTVLEDKLSAKVRFLW